MEPVSATYLSGFIWFIECFKTTFLHTHHSLLAKLGQWGWLMRMRLAWNKSQTTLDTSKRLHQNNTQSTWSAGKGLDSQLCHYWELQTRKWVGLSHPWGSWEGVKSICRHTTYHGTVGCRRSQSKDSCFVWGSFITHHYPGSTKLAFTSRHAGRGVPIITQILHRYPLHISVGLILLNVLRPLFCALTLG